MSGRRRVDAKLHAQGFTLRDWALELALRKRFHRIAGRYRIGLFWGRLQGGRILRLAHRTAGATRAPARMGFRGRNRRRAAAPDPKP